MPVSRPVAGGIAAVSLSVATAMAQSAAPVDDDLHEVIVSARSLEVSTPLELARYGYDVDFVGSEEIRDHGFVDLPQALEMLVPGAYVAPQAGAFSYVNLSLQGSRNGDVLWTVDGVRMNNRLYNTTSPADTLPASMVERLEVMKGSHGLLYGTQAVAGVINVVTRSFAERPGGAITVGGDSRDGLHADAWGRGALGNHRFVGWVSKDRTDGFSPYDAYQPGATTRDRRYDMQSFGLKYGYAFTDNLRLTLQGVHTEGEVDFATPARTDVNERDEDIFSARLDYTASDRAEFYLKGYFHDWDTDYYPALNPADTAYWGFRDKGISAATKLNVTTGLEYHLGYEFQSYGGRDDYLLIAEQDEKAHAVYGQVRSTEDFSTRGRFTLGVRHTDTGKASATVWAGSFAYDLGAAHYVEASGGSAFRLPDAYQLYAIDPDDGIHGNPDLVPEESFNLNLAIGRYARDGGIGWQLTGWRRKVENLIRSDSTNPPAGFDGVYVNTDQDVKQSGIEALVVAPLGDLLSVEASYMYSRERIATGQLANRPEHSGKLTFQLGGGAQRWGANLALKYVGSTHSDVAGFGRVAYGNDLIANLGVHGFLDNARHHRIGVRVENLFDREYAVLARSAVLAGSPTSERFIYRNRGTPRTAYASYTYAF